VSAQHSQPIAVLPQDIDALGHVNNMIYLRWVQDATVAHWQRTAPPSAVTEFQWVAIRHDITYRRPAFLGDAIVARVTLESVRRESAFYVTRIQRGDEILAEISSRWCCMDTATMRPARLPDEVVSCFFAEPPVARTG
jgi:acyl-CoA thioester hydrolase